ncbi:MAG: pyridoxamine 5'-phosphate oxidase family protein [Candidatus Micrarchaeota archaeon]|nr:pyridoxamine 5'-phosphate oxidase family protein [Candidatus Micrarchaeota archaeon]
MEKAGRAEIMEIVKSILQKGYLMSLATADDGGPWICEIVYVLDSDFNIYWLSSASARHSKAILSNPKVAAAITVSDRPGQQTESVQISGTARMLEGDFLDLARLRGEKLGVPIPKEEGETLVYNDKRYGGKHCWFKMTPAKFDVLYKARFGDDKAVLEL